MFYRVAIFAYGIVFVCVGYADDTGFASGMRIAARTAQSCPLVDDTDAADESLIEVKSSTPVYVPTKAEIGRCIKDAGEIKKFIHAGNSLVIDAREGGNSMNPIDGTISVPLYAVHSKSFIVDRNVVLLGNGVDDSQLVQECLRVQRVGAKRVYVLKGGIRSWVEKVNDAEKLLSLADKSVLPNDIYKKTLGEDWVLLIESSSISTEREIRTLFPGVQLLATDDTPQLGRVLKKRKNSRLLVISGNGDGYHAVNALLQQHGVRNDYYLQGGLAAYRQYLMTQQASIRRMQKKAARKKMLCGG